MGAKKRKPQVDSSGFTLNKKKIAGKVDTRKRRILDHASSSSPYKKQRTELMTGSQEQSHETVNFGNHYEENLAAYAIFKLCQNNEVHDWRLGMQKPMFPKFDDVVIGLQNNKDDSFHYYAIQLKAFDENGTGKPTYTSSTLLNYDKNKKKGLDFNLWSYYFNGFLKINSGLRARTKNMILFTQQRLSIKSHHSELFEDLPYETLKEITAFLPQIDTPRSEKEPNILKRINMLRIGDLIKCLTDQNITTSLEDLKEFIEKVIFVSGQLSSNEIDRLGKEHVKNGWEKLRYVISEFRHDGGQHWKMKSLLMRHSISFQGNDQSAMICDLIAEPDASLLLNILTNPKGVSCGKKVKGLGEMERYFVRRNFERIQSEKGKEGKLVIKSEEQLLSERVVIIEGEPGLGKSVTLLHAAREFKRKTDCQKESNSDLPLTWVIELNAASVSHAFSNFGHEKNLFKLLQESIKAREDSIECTLITQLSGNTDSKVEIAIFLDGLDEINSDYIDAVLDWLKALNQWSKVKKLWVSTRKHLKEKVKEACSAEAFTIATFSKTDHIAFLLKFWNIEKLTPKLKCFVKRMLNYHNLSKEVQTFIGLPLLTMMFAEIYGNTLSQIMDGQLFDEDWNPRDFNIKLLFEVFIDQKFEVEHAKYYPTSQQSSQFKDSTLSCVKRAFVENHEMLSLWHIFHHYEGFHLITSKQDKKMMEKLRNEIKAGNVISGLVSSFQDGDQLIFIHQMFPEYFTAHWLFRTLLRLKEEEESFGERPTQLKNLIEFLQMHHTKNECAHVRLFLSFMAAEKCEGHKIIINSIFHSCMFDKKGINLEEEDELGRKPIHLALEMAEFATANELQITTNETTPAGNFWDEILRNEWFVWACNQSETDLAARILEHYKADVNHKESTIGRGALHFACTNGDYNTAMMLLGSHADINLVDKWGETPLHYAVEAGQVEMLQRLFGIEDLMGKLNINAQNKWDAAPLHKACSLPSGSCKTAKTLLEKGADINVANDDGYTPLHLAFRNGSIDTIMMLLDHDDISNRVNVNTVDKVGETALHIAVKDHDTYLVRILLEKGANVNAVTTEGNTPLLCATLEWGTKGMSETVKLLLERGALVNATDKKYKTPLHYVSYFGDMAFMKMLLGKSDVSVRGIANVNALDEEGKSSLHHACNGSQTEAARFLIENGAYSNIPDKWGKTPLHFASERDNVAIMAMLLRADCKAGVNAVDADGRTPLHFACRARGNEAAQLLIENGADITAVDKQGNTSLHDACDYGRTETAKLLIENGADINSIGEFDRTPLHLSCVYKYHDKEDIESCIELLIANGASISVADKDLKTPLHYACTHHTSLVKIIVKHIDMNVELQDRKAEIINARDYQGNTPLHEAYGFTLLKWRHIKHTIQYLLEHGACPNIENKKGLKPEACACRDACIDDNNDDDNGDDDDDDDDHWLAQCNDDHIIDNPPNSDFECDDSNEQFKYIDDFFDEHNDDHPFEYDGEHFDGDDHYSDSDDSVIMIELKKNGDVENEPTTDQD